MFSPAQIEELQGIRSQVIGTMYESVCAKEMTQEQFQHIITEANKHVGDIKALMALDDHGKVTAALVVLDLCIAFAKAQ